VTEAGTILFIGGANSDWKVRLKQGGMMNRNWDSEWMTQPGKSGPIGGSYAPGSSLPMDSETAIRTRGLDIPGVQNNAKVGGVFTVKEEIPAIYRTSIGGTTPEIYIEPRYRTSIQELLDYRSYYPK